MITREEKLSILTEMIAFAKSDNKVSEVEYSFLLAVANQIGVDKSEFDALFHHPAPLKPIANESERIVQFHRLVLLMNIDQNVHEEERIRLHQFGLRMGLNPLAMDKVLEIMTEYENNLIPPDVLLGIFKTYYN
ncbi:MAG: TerB family tellurite resistance protein [Flavobacteriaceae bacterium]|nr:TerB family tellurite resistance protein [Flavobacteriaceae bacterium]